MNNTRLIFAGPVGAGKSTAVRTLSEIPVVSTEREASDMTLNLKAETTVAMDYGKISHSDEIDVHIYGLPGQQRFEFMWEILTTNDNANLALLLDNRRKNPCQDMKFFLQKFKRFYEANRMVIGVTGMDVSDKVRLSDYQDTLDSMGISAPLLRVDARERDDMLKLVTMSMSLVGGNDRDPFSPDASLDCVSAL